MLDDVNKLLLPEYKKQDILTFSIHPKNKQHLHLHFIFLHSFVSITFTIFFSTPLSLVLLNLLFTLIIIYDDKYINLMV